MPTPVDFSEQAPVKPNDASGILRELPLLDLAAALEAGPIYGVDSTEFDTTLKHAALALRVAAAAALAQNECRLRAPYEPMYRIRDAKGERWTCGHNPPHETAA